LRLQADLCALAAIALCAALASLAVSRYHTPMCCLFYRLALRRRSETLRHGDLQRAWAERNALL